MLARLCLVSLAVLAASPPRAAEGQFPPRPTSCIYAGKEFSEGSVLCVAPQSSIDCLSGGKWHFNNGQTCKGELDPFKSGWTPPPR